MKRRRKKEVSRYKSQRARAWRNLMVSVINAALERNLASLEYSENEDQPKQTCFDFALANGMQCRGCVNGTRHGELSFAVCVNHKAEEAPSANCSLRTCDATAFGWLERKDGKWLQDSRNISCRRPFLTHIADLDIEPMGYSDRGKLM